MSSRPPVVAFLWSTNAGHRAQLGRIRPHLEARTDIDAHVFGVESYDPAKRLERLRLGPIAGRLRPSLTVREVLRSRAWDGAYIVTRGWRGNRRALARIPTVYAADSTSAQLDRMPEYGGSGTGRGLGPWVDRRHFLAATHLEMPSNWAREGALEWGVPGDRISVNHPGVDLDVWRPTIDDPPRADDPVRRVLFVGGDFDRKGGPELLEWFRAEQDPTLELHLVTTAAVEPREREFVHRLDAAQPEFHELVRRSHVSVLPSRAECYGLASVEALASGVPVIQSTVGGAADIVTPDETGRLIPPKDPSAIGSAIRDVLADSERYARMRRAARADAERRFDIERTVDDMVNTVLATVGRSRPE